MATSLSSTTAPAIRIAVVTGASSGIGRAASLALHKTGWTVVLVARRREQLEETGRLMSETGDRVGIVTADLAKEEDIAKVFEYVRREYGRLDLLFNNAGLNVPAIPMEDLTTAQFRSLMDVNVTACFICAQEAIRIMKTQEPKGGRIINNGSISAYTPRVFSAPYTMSKHAITGLTKSLALDGREHNIACSQLDVGGAGTGIQGTIGKLQPNGTRVHESLFEVDYAGSAVAYMANLPLGVNILSQTIMATDMPFVGRG